MKMTDKVRVNTRLEDVWRVVGDPNSWKVYHSKIEEIECDCVREGGKVSAILNFRGKRFLCEGRIATLRELETIRVEFTGEKEGTDNPITFSVSYRLSRGFLRGVKVVETVVYDVHIPWPFRLLICLITRFGRTVGPDHLKAMKKLIERHGRM